MKPIWDSKDPERVTDPLDTIQWDSFRKALTAAGRQLHLDDEATRAVIYGHDFGDSERIGDDGAVLLMTMAGDEIRGWEAFYAENEDEEDDLDRSSTRAALYAERKKIE